MYGTCRGNPGLLAAEVVLISLSSRSLFIFRAVASLEHSGTVRRLPS
jgi:hypothetical protein